MEAESKAKAKRRLSVNVDEESGGVPATKRRLVDSMPNNKMVIDLTMDSRSSPTPSGSIPDAVTIRGSSPLAYGSEGEEEEVRTLI